MKIAKMYIYIFFNAIWLFLLHQTLIKNIQIPAFTLKRII